MRETFERETIPSQSLTASLPLKNGGWETTLSFLVVVTSGTRAMLAMLSFRGVYGWDLKSQDYKYLFNLKLLISTQFSGGYT